MILIVSVCEEKLHELECVLPIQKSIAKHKQTIIKHYTQLSQQDIDDAQGIVICGTALKDDGYLKNIKVFDWVKTITKPLLGICAGMQIIGIVHGSQVHEATQIGNYSLQIEHLLFDAVQEIYLLHHLSISAPQGFEVVAEVDNQPIIIQRGNLLGILFHPEVNNASLIEKWASSF